MNCFIRRPTRRSSCKGLSSGVFAVDARYDLRRSPMAGCPPVRQHCAHSLGRRRGGQFQQAPTVPARLGGLSWMRQSDIQATFAFVLDSIHQGPEMLECPELLSVVNGHSRFSENLMEPNSTCSLELRVGRTGALVRLSGRFTHRPISNAEGRRTSSDGKGVGRAPVCRQR